MNEPPGQVAQQRKQRKDAQVGEDRRPGVAGPAGHRWEGYSGSVAEKRINEMIDLFNDYVRQADEAFKEKKYSTAIKNWKKCFQYNNDSKTAYLIGNAYRQMNDFPLAEKWLLAAGEIHPMVMKSFYDLGEMLFGVKERRWRSCWAFERFIQLTKDFRTVRIKKKREEIEKLRNKSKDYLKELDEIYLINFNQGRKALANKRYKEAYEKLLTSYWVRDNPQTALLIARSLRKLKNYKDAAKFFSIAVSMKPAIPEAYFEFGEMWIEAGKKGEAKRHLQRFLLLMEKHIDKKKYKKLIKQANEYLKSLESSLAKDFDLAKKAFDEKKYIVAYKHFRNSYFQTKDAETAYYLGLTGRELKLYYEAQTWFALAGEEKLEAIFDIGEMWFKVDSIEVRFLAQKYFTSFLNLVKIIKQEEEHKELIEKAKKYIAQLDKLFAEKWKQLIVLGTGKIPLQFLNAYLEIGEMFVDVEDKRWLADRYLKLYLELTRDYRNKVEFVVKRNSALKSRKKLDELFKKFRKNARAKLFKEEYEEAVRLYKIALKINPESDYTMLLQALNALKKSLG